MTTWSLSPLSYYPASTLIELRQGGVPVLIRVAGYYPKIVDDEGRTIDDVEYVLVQVGGYTQGETRVANSLDVDRWAGWRRSRGCGRSHGRITLSPTEWAGLTYEQQVSTLIARAEPLIANALADHTVRADEDAAEVTVCSAVESLPATLSRIEYERWCAAHDVDALSDAECDSYGTHYMQCSYPEYPVARVISHAAARRRLAGIEAERPAVPALAERPALRHASGDFGLAVLVGDAEFKPDASAAPVGSKCAVCGTTRGVAWIAGAGSPLCHQHQDDY